MYGASIKQESCITTVYKKTCFEPINWGGGGANYRVGCNNFFL